MPSLFLPRGGGECPTGPPVLQLPRLLFDCSEVVEACSASFLNCNDDAYVNQPAVQLEEEGEVNSIHSERSTSLLNAVFLLSVSSRLGGLGAGHR